MSDGGSDPGTQPDSDPPCTDGRASSQTQILPFGPFPTLGLRAPPPARCSAAPGVFFPLNILTIWHYTNADVDADAIIHTWRGRIRVQSAYSITPFHGVVQEEWQSIICGQFDFHDHEGMHEQSFVVFRKSTDTYEGWDQRMRAVKLTRLLRQRLVGSIWCDVVPVLNLSEPSAT